MVKDVSVDAMHCRKHSNILISQYVPLLVCYSLNADLLAYIRTFCIAFDIPV